MKSLAAAFALIAFAAGVASSSGKKQLPRGDLGFSLGDTLDSADATARQRGFQELKGTNVSVAPDDWRDFQIQPKQQFQFVTMFLASRKITEITTVYDPSKLKPSFKDVLHELEHRLGPAQPGTDHVFENPIYWGDGKTPTGRIDRVRTQSAYWFDGRTVVALEGRTRQDMRELSITYMDLPKGHSVRFGIIGGHKSVSFTGEE